MNEVIGGEYAAQAVLIFVGAYLLGGFPTAYIVAAAQGINIFEVGSGNMGGTNVARAAGKGWAIFTGVVDALKGLAAVWLARDLLLPAEPGLATSLAATGAVVGHNWSLWATLLTASFQGGRLNLVLRGGKGAATAFGAMLLIQPAQLLVAGLVGGAIVAGTRYVSLGVLVGFAIANLWLIAQVLQASQDSALLLFALALSGMLLLRHRGNVERLLAGTERRLGERAS